MKRIWLLSIFLMGLFLCWCSDSLSTNDSATSSKSVYTTEKSQIRKNANYISIKYRDTSVDVSEFESFNTSKSSFIEKAYYDKDNQYLILNLNWTYYHWCEVPEYTWNEFKRANSLWKYYNQYIKWNYDCRLWYIPQYN